MSITNQGICNCERCGLAVRLGGPKNPDARLLRRATSPSGYCASCAATQFLKTTGPLLELLGDPEKLRNPLVQAQFSAVLRSGGADASASEIDWERVIENWTLPVAGEKQARKRAGLDLGGQP